MPAEEAVARTPAPRPSPKLRDRVAMALELARRGVNEIVRVPGASVPGVISPAIFLLGLVLVFGKATDLPGYGTSSFLAFILPVALMQSAGFTGGATGVNLGRDIEQGWMDRLLLSPAGRGTILAGIILSAAVRVLIPVPALLVIAIVAGAPLPSLAGLLLVFVLVPWFAAVAASWAATLALVFRTQQASPLIQASILATVLFTPSYAPTSLMQPWMQTVSDLNPVSHVVVGLRQVFVGELSWTTTGSAALALVGLSALIWLLAFRQLRRYEA